MDPRSALLALERGRSTPALLAFAVAAGRGRRDWADPERRRRSLRAVAPLAAGTAEHEALARRHMVLDAMRDALIWRPWTLDRAPLHGGEHAAGALGGGRGVLAAYCHFGFFPAISRALRNWGAPVHSTAASWMFDPPPDDWRGPRRVAWRRLVEEAGVHLIAAEGSYDRVVALLRRGEVVAVTIDMPGSVPTDLLGLRASLSSGPARMAFEAGAVVVPLVRPPQPRRLRTIAGEPLDARAFARWEDLHHAVAAVHDRWMARAPWAHEIPARLVAE